MKIEYNIISRGTEKDGGSKGYMAVIEPIDGKRYIMPLEHSIASVDALTKDYLAFDEGTSILAVALARFMLISALTLDRINIDKASKILVVGAGCVGCGLLYNLKSRDYKDVTFATRSKKDIGIYNWTDIKDVDYGAYDVILDTTGTNEVIENIFINASPMTIVVLLGTPRHKPNVDMLSLHRKNLLVYGGHELFGYTADVRQNTFDKCIDYVRSSNIDLDKLCDIVSGVDNNSKKIYQIIKR